MLESKSPGNGRSEETFNIVTSELSCPPPISGPVLKPSSYLSAPHPYNLALTSTLPHQLGVLQFISVLT